MMRLTLLGTGAPARRQGKAHRRDGGVYPGNIIWGEDLMRVDVAGVRPGQHLG